MIGTISISIDLLLTRVYGLKKVTFHVYRQFPKSLQKYIYDTLKNPYRWTAAHPWRNDGWRPYCVVLSRKPENKYGRPVTILDKVTDLEEIYTSGPELCLWKGGNMYCVRKLESITDDRSRLEFNVVEKGLEFPFESERIVYSVEPMNKGKEEMLNVGVHVEATMKSRLGYLFNKPKHEQMETSILEYISTTFDVPPVKRYM